MQSILARWEVGSRGGEGARIAVTTVGGSLTFAQVWDHSNRIARLVGSGVPEGRLVALSLPNSLEFVPAFLALARMSCPVALVSPKFGPMELGEILDELRPAAILTTKEIATEIAAKLPQRSFKVSASCAVQRELSLVIPVAAATEAPFLPTDAALIKFSSGSTGTPKGICLTAANLLAETETVVTSLRTDPGTRILCPVSLTHSYGFDLGVLPMLASGCALHASEALVPRQVHKLLSENQPTVFLGVPAIYRALLATARDSARRLNPNSRLLSCTAPLSPETIIKFFEAFGAPICQHYGSSETGAVALQDPADVLKQSASVGRAMNNVTVFVRDAQGQAIVDGCDGEIIVQSDAVAWGYVMGRPAGRSSFEGRTYHTGDLGSLDRDGFLIVHGRLDDLINVGGNKVSPAEVVRALESSPAVAEAGAARMRDGYGEETVYAIVVLKRPSTEAELISYCRRQLAEYKVPRRIDICDALPRGPSGKVRVVAPEVGHDPR